MGVIAFANFATRDGGKGRVEFSSDRYSGEARAVRLSPACVVINEDSDPEALIPFRVCTGTVSVIDFGTIDPAGLMPANAHDIAVRVIVTPPQSTEERITFRGYAATDSRDNIYPSRYEEYAVPIVSPLGTSEAYRMPLESNSDVNGFVTIAEVLYEALTLCGYTDSDALTFPALYEVDGTRGPLEVLECEFSRALLWEEKEEGDVPADDGTRLGFKRFWQGIHVSDALDMVMRVLGMTLHDGPGGVIITAPVAGVKYATISLQYLRALRIMSKESLENLTTITDAVSVDLSGLRLYGTGHVRSLFAGARRVKVTTELGAATDNLLPDLDGFKNYVNQYSRPLYQSDGRGTDSYITTVVFSRYEDTAAGNKTAYPYEVAPGQQPIDDYGGPWYPVSDTDKWDYTLNRNQATKPGSFFCNIFGDDSPDNATRLPGTGNMADTSNVAGLMINPTYLEYGCGPYINDTYPMLRLEAAIPRYYGPGTLITLNLTTAEYPSACNPSTAAPVYDADRRGVHPNCTLYADMYVGGDQIWQVYSTRNLDGTTPGEGKTNEINLVGGDKTPFPGGVGCLPYNPTGIVRGENLIGAKFTVPDSGLYGPLSLTLRILPYKATTANAPRPMMFFIAGLEAIVPILSGNINSDVRLLALGEKKRDSRVITHDTVTGQDGDEADVTLKLGAYEDKDSGALATLIYRLSPVTTWRDTMTETDATPDRLLLNRMAALYDRTTEVRTITISEAPVGVGTAVKDGEDTYQIVARSADYAEGVNTWTLIKLPN